MRNLNDIFTKYKNNIESSNKNKFRHEYKYIVDDKTLLLCYERLINICKLDKNIMNGKSYEIRSVYFDDYKNSFYYENENGENIRHKYRIRIYNRSDEYISLEKKSKKNTMTLKKSERITKDITNKLLEDMFIDDICQMDNGLLKEFIIKRELLLLKPAVIVQYERIPFVYNDGNVRITLDRNIQASKDFSHFFDTNMLVWPVMNVNEHVLEIKWDEYLPSFIRKQLNLGTLSRCSYSKYYLCRGGGGYIK